MKGDNGASHREAIKNIACYLLGIVTVAVVCCGTESVWQAIELNDSVGAATSSGYLSTVAFDFEKGFEDIAGINASAYAIGIDENPMHKYELQKKDGLLVVEVEVIKGMTVHFDFQFVNSDGEEIASFNRQVEISQSLMTFNDLEFGGDGQVLEYLYPSEVEVYEGESAEISISDGQMKLWYDGHFHTVRRLVSSSGNSTITSPDCSLQQFGSPSNVGIISDAGSDEIILLEAVSNPE